MSETFGQMVRRLRLERGLSQSELSRLAHADPSYVHLLERSPAGRQRPSRTIIAAIASALDLSYAERDRFLFAAGLAPDQDYQTLAEDLWARLVTVAEAVEGMKQAVSEVSLEGILDATVPPRRLDRPGA